MEDDAEAATLWGLMRLMRLMRLTQSWLLDGRPTVPVGRMAMLCISDQRTGTYYLLVVEVGYVLYDSTRTYSRYSTRSYSTTT